MAINRYSRGPIAADVQSSFIPLPIDLLDRQMQREQTKYDAAKAFIGTAQEAVYDVKGVSPDSETLKNITSQYDEQIQKEVERVGGDYGKLKSFADQLGQKVSKDIKSGHLGAIHNNFIKAQNRLDELNKLRNDKKIRESTYNKHLNEIQAFGGTIEDGRGGYTTMSFAPVTNMLEFGEVADDYGTEIADQFKANGTKYIDAKTASDLIEKNLWNNQQLLENAEDEIWNAYGDLPQDKKSVVLGSYIKHIAATAGNKLAYQERFKPDPTKTSTNVLEPGRPIIYNIQGNKSLNNKINFDGIDLGGLVTNMEAKDESSWLGNIWENIQYAAAASTGNTKVLNEVDKELENKKVAKESEVQKEVDKIVTVPLFQELAKIHGVDLNNATKETIRELKTKFENFNLRSQATSVTFPEDWERKNKIEGKLLDSGFLSNVQAINLKTGEPLNGSKEWSNMTADHHSKDPKRGRLLYSGSIQTAGEVYPKGSDIVTYFDPNTNEYTDVLLSTDIQDNTVEFLQDRALAAYNSNNGQPGGISNWGQHTFLVTNKKDANGQYVIAHYINGKPARQ